MNRPDPSDPSTLHERSLRSGGDASYRELAMREARYRLLFESIDDGFCVVEVLENARGEPVDYLFRETNPAFARQTGLENVVGRRLRELAPDLEPQWFEVYGRVAATGEPVRFQRRAEALNRWFDVYAFRIGGREERQVAILFRDVTDEVTARAERSRLLNESDAAREEAERARAEAVAAERRLQTVVERAPALVAVTDGPEHRFVLANPVFASVARRGDLVGRTVGESLPEFEALGLVASLDTVYATGRTHTADEQRIVLTGDANDFEGWFDLVFQPIPGADGSVTGILLHAIEVTTQVRARHELERARAEAEAANRAKSEFLAVMSHELRTPLNAIGGYAELLAMGLRGPVTEEQLLDLERIQRSQRHLLGLINEVLNYARLESGSVTYHLQPTLVADVVARVAPLVEPQRSAKRLVLDVHLPEYEAHPPLYVQADADKLQQILLNLLSNAIKFTEEGGEVRIELHPLPDADGMAVLRVEDTGIGIPSDKLEVIFEPFVQVRADLTRTVEGTGLGLAISRDLARGMGGELTAESVVGRGSVFTLRLPAAPHPGDAAGGPDQV